MNTMKNIIFLKNLPSNLVEEAIVVLKENTHIQKYQIKELEENNKQMQKESKIDDKNLMNKKHVIEGNKNIKGNKKPNYNEQYKEKNNEYIIKEAEMLIKNYIENLEKKGPKWKNNMKKLEKRYKNSVKLNFILAFTTLIGLLFAVI